MLEVTLWIYFFPGLFFIIEVWGFGVGVLYSVFWGWVFQSMEFVACGVGPSGVFGLRLSI